jgi:hypothetical protein
VARITSDQKLARASVHFEETPGSLVTALRPTTNEKTDKKKKKKEKLCF